MTILIKKEYFFTLRDESALLLYRMDMFTFYSKNYYDTTC